MGQRVHRLPTSVLVAVVLVSLLPGAVWWSRAAPDMPPASPIPSESAPAPAEEPADGGVLVLQMGDGTVVVDESGVSTLYRGMRQSDSRARPILGGQLPCRIGGRGSILEDFAAGERSQAVSSRPGLVLVPRCGRPQR